MKKIFVVVVVLFVVSTFFGCIPLKTLKESDVTFANEMVENVLLAHNEQNYEMWARNMGEEMLKAVPEEQFVEKFKVVYDKIGKYIPNSKSFIGAFEKNGIIVVQYMAKFTNEEQVKLTFTFKDVNGQKKIVGEFYDSQKLRGK